MIKGIYNLEKSENAMHNSLVTHPLMELCESITDCHHSTPEYLDSGYLVIRNFNIKNGRLLLGDSSYTSKESFYDRIARSKPEPGDLILTREAPMGEVCIVPEGIECCLGQRMVLIKPNKKKVDNKYLLYVLLSQYAQNQIKQSEGTGSIVSNLRIPTLKEIKIPYFNLDTQKNIGLVLSTIDSKIELNKRIDFELESTIKVLYEYWFVQYDFPDNNNKPYKTNGGKMSFNAELGRDIPKGWNIDKFINITNWISGSQPPKSTFIHKENEGYVRFIQNRDYASGEHKTYIKVSPNNKLCDEYDIMIDKYGNAATVRFGIAGAYNVALSKIEVYLKDGQEFIRNYLKSDSVYNYLNKACMASTRASLSRENLIFLEVVVPPFHLLNEFEGIAKNVIKSVLKNRKENQKLSELRDWLLPMLMNGQVKVK